MQVAPEASSPLPCYVTIAACVVILNLAFAMFAATSDHKLLHVYTLTRMLAGVRAPSIASTRRG